VLRLAGPPPSPAPLTTSRPPGAAGQSGRHREGQTSRARAAPRIPGRRPAARHLHRPQLGRRPGRAR